MSSKLDPGRHYLDLGRPIDERHSHWVRCNMAKYICVLRGIKENPSRKIGLRQLSVEIHTKLKGTKAITPLASGCFLIEFQSAELLSKAINSQNFSIGGVLAHMVLPSSIKTFDVVIHGVPLDENLVEFQNQLVYDCSNGACLVGAARLQNKYKQNSRAVKLTFSGSCPLEVRLANTSIPFRTETCATPVEVFQVPGVWSHLTQV